MSADTEPPCDDLPTVSYREALRTWTKIGLNSFGGPAGQIAVMHRILVEEKRWISESRFLHALNYCMLLPGPEATQLATYVGWLLHRTLGGLTAGILFVLPGFVSILVLSVLYAGFRDVGVVDGLFYGIKPAVLAVVIEAVVRIGRRALRNGVMVAIAVAAFVAIFFLHVPFPFIIVSAALIGYAGGRWRPDRFVLAVSGTRDVQDTGTARAPDVPDAAPTLLRSLRTLLFWSLLWFAPLVLLWIARGGSDVYVQEGVFFSKAAVVTFGGAYAVLAYIAQQAVENYGWLAPGEMLDGLGMAETTPGPLIQVVQFVGFMGAYRSPGDLPPMLAGVLASILVTWVTFIPCFLWIFLGAPYMEVLRGRRSLTAAMSAITAAVVGVILNLAIWFALHTLFADVGERRAGPLYLLVPDLTTTDVVSVAIAAAAMVALFRFRTGMIPTLVTAAALGAAWQGFVRG